MLGADLRAAHPITKNARLDGPPMGALQRASATLAMLGSERICAPTGSVNMEYRGIEYTVIQGSQPDVWKWSVMVGDPKMLRIGEASSEHRAEIQVRSIIDRALTIQKGES
jgi:hypothetical protein